MFALALFGCSSDSAVAPSATPPARSVAAAASNADHRAPPSTATASSAAPPGAFAMVTLVLYQPESVLQERLQNVDELAAFAKSVERTVAAAFPTGSLPRELDVVIAIKPGRKARFWFIQTPVASAIPADLEGALEALKAPAVDRGPIAIGLIGSVSGASTQANSPSFSPPMPQEWRDAAAKNDRPAILPEGVLKTLWPD